MLMLVILVMLMMLMMLLPLMPPLRACSAALSLCIAAHSAPQVRRHEARGCGHLRGECRSASGLLPVDTPALSRARHCHVRLPPSQQFLRLTSDMTLRGHRGVARFGVGAPHRRRPHHLCQHAHQAGTNLQATPVVITVAASPAVVLAATSAVVARAAHA